MNHEGHLAMTPPATCHVIDAVRTPRGRGKAGVGALAGVHPQELVAQALRAVQARVGFDTDDVDDVILGAVSQVGEQGANIARNAVLAAGWPDRVPGVSINRFCGSGLQALQFGAMGVLSGAMTLVVAGGVESMSRVPMGADGGGMDGTNLVLRKRVVQVPQGVSADLIATIEGFSRTDVDAFALDSQRKAARAIAEQRFARSLVPVRDPSTGVLLLDHEEYPRPGTTADALARLEPSFAKLGSLRVGSAGQTFDELAVQRYPQVARIDHVHTAGNSSGIVDGAAVVVLASDDYVRAHGLTSRARIRAMATIGVEPILMLNAPAPVSRKVLDRAGMQVADIDVWEINEAFAAVVLQATRALALDPMRVNVNGGSIALGHPLGATGAMLLGTALDELERVGAATALVTLCIGGGQGVAVILER